MLEANYVCDVCSKKTLAETERRLMPTPEGLFSVDLCTVPVGWMGLIGKDGKDKILCSEECLQALVNIENRTIQRFKRGEEPYEVKPMKKEDLS